MKVCSEKVLYCIQCIDINITKNVTWKKVNPFLCSTSILYALKTTENQMFSGVSKGQKMGSLAKNGLRCLKDLQTSWKLSQ